MTALAAELERLAGPGAWEVPVGESKHSHVMGYGGYGCFQRVKSREVVDGILGPTDLVISNILVPQTAQDL